MLLIFMKVFEIVSSALFTLRLASPLRSLGIAKSQAQSAGFVNPSGAEPPAGPAPFWHSEKINQKDDDFRHDHGLRSASDRQCRFCHNL